MRSQNTPFDLEDRLVDFACTCLEVGDLLPDTKAGKNLEYQLVKSGTAGALNYGEAQAAESPADFLHRIKLGIERDKGIKSESQNNQENAISGTSKSGNSF